MARRKPFLRARFGAILAGFAVLFVPTAAAADSGERDAYSAAVSVMTSPSNGTSQISVVQPDGSARVVWRCPHDRFCGDLVSSAWAPDGRHVAISLTEIGGRSLYPGLHVVDTKTGRDVNITGIRHDASAQWVSAKEWKALSSVVEGSFRRFGCLVPGELAWSPDGSKIAYACPVHGYGEGGSTIHLMNADGSRSRLLRTGTSDAAWPAWSPDGTRIAFSTAVELRQNAQGPTSKAVLTHSDIYTVRLDGSGRRRIARQGVAPAWSPDGTAIAYRGLCGTVRLVTPAGHDATPGGHPGACPGFGTLGWPAWSGDGTLVIGGKSDAVLVDPVGRHSTLIPDSVNSGLTAELRPVVRPAPAHPLSTSSLAAATATGQDTAITLPLRASSGVYSLALVGPDGVRHEVWRCPRSEYCGELSSVAWSPDGRRLALSFEEYGGHSLYPGLHVIDLTTGRDRKLFGLSRRFLGSLSEARALIHRYGCWNAVELAWSPDGGRLAYACATIRAGYQSSQIHIIDADGKHPRLLRTGTVGAAWPAWSPGGTRIAFSTGNWPREGVRTNTDQPKRILHSVIYSVDLQGAHRRRIATGAQPAWSPDGSTIAYRSDCGGRIRLVSPAGADVTPAGASGRCPGIGPEGVPAWAPDGSTLAIGNEHGIFLFDPGGAGPVFAPGSSRAGLVFDIRPALRPAASG
jgi:Tol biopolymer transport system component